VTPPGDRRPSEPSLRRDQAFVRLWFGQTVSLVGSQISVVALPLTAILIFDASAFQLGLLGGVEFLPFLLLGLPAGVWVDRARKRPVMIWADVGRLAAVGSVPLAWAFGLLTLTQLYVVAFVAGCLTVFFDVAYAAYLPALIDRSRLVEGNSKLEVSRSGAQVAGPGLAGLLVQAFSAPGALLADALSYGASVVSLLLIRAAEPMPDTSGPRPAMRGQIAEGLGYVWRHPLLRPTAACTAMLNLFSMMSQAVILLFAVGRLGMSPGTIGLALTLGNVGLLVGAVLTARVVGRIGVGGALVGAPLAMGIGAALVPLASISTAVPVIVASGAIASFGVVAYNINARSLAQSVSPEHMVGRVIATLRFVVWGVIPVGSLLGGWLGSKLGLRPTLWIAAIGMAAATLPPALSPVRALRTMPDEPDRLDGGPPVA
jgi:MFS family permease